MKIYGDVLFIKIFNHTEKRLKKKKRSKIHRYTTKGDLEIFWLYHWNKLFFLSLLISKWLFRLLNKWIFKYAYVCKASHLKLTTIETASKFHDYH